MEEIIQRVHLEYAGNNDVNSINVIHYLPEEIEEGNVEYKLQLLQPSTERLCQLTTQLHWRLNEGNGIAYYEIGVQDNGLPVGIQEDQLIQSLYTLDKMCQVVKATMEIVYFRSGTNSLHRSVRMKIERIPEDHITTKKQVRISMIGDFESGKSTLISVLIRPCLDDGYGLARMQVLNHRHEIENGSTSSISEHTIEIYADGRIKSQHRPIDAYEICAFDSDEEDSFDYTNDLETDTVFSMDNDDIKEDGSTEVIRLLTFSDLAGHKKYQKITASGLASQFPDYVVLVVDASKGIQPMTKEHVGIASALDLSIIVVLTKVDLVESDRLNASLEQVYQMLACFCPKLRITTNTKNFISSLEIPLFQVSSVTGNGLDGLRDFLTNLPPTRKWSTQNKSAPEFYINHVYDFQENDELIVTGLLKSGILTAGDDMLLGPDVVGQFSLVKICSIEVQRVPASCLYAGENGAVAIRPSHSITLPTIIRKGMMLVHPSVQPMATLQFDAVVQVLLGSPEFRENNQVVIHAGCVQQMAKVIRMVNKGTDEIAKDSIPIENSISEQPVRSPTLCRFEFMYRPEYIQPDIPLVLREGSARAVGRVVRTIK